LKPKGNFKWLEIISRSEG